MVCLGYWQATATITHTHTYQHTRSQVEKCSFKEALLVVHASAQTAALQPIILPTSTTPRSTQGNGKTPISQATPSASHSALLDLLQLPSSLGQVSIE